VGPNQLDYLISFKLHWISTRYVAIANSVQVNTLSLQYSCNNFAALASMLLPVLRFLTDILEQHNVVLSHCKLKSVNAFEDVTKTQSSVLLTMPTVLTVC